MRRCVAIPGMLTLSHLVLTTVEETGAAGWWNPIGLDYLCRGLSLHGPRGQGYLRFLGKWQSGQITLKVNKPWGINDESGTGLDVFAFPMLIGRGRQMS